MKTTVSMMDLLPIIEEKLGNNSDVTLLVKGSSMRPFFQSNQTSVTLRKVNTTLKKWDVVLYRMSNNLIGLHRIVDIKGDYYVLCGDALMIKETIHKDAIMAVVCSFSEKGQMTDVTDLRYIRKVRWWVRFMFLRSVLLTYQKLVKGR